MQKFIVQTRVKEFFEGRTSFRGVAKHQNLKSEVGSSFVGGESKFSW
jgi:hypothetical protein